MRKSKGYSKGGARMMRARGGKMMAKGMSKGGARMMRARGGKMAKGYAKGGTKMMRAMGGKMAKGYSKGGAKMMKASLGGLTMIALRTALKKVRPGFKMSDPIRKNDLERAAKFFTTRKVATPRKKPATKATVTGGKGPIKNIMDLSQPAKPSKANFLARRGTGTAIGLTGAAAYMATRGKKKDEKKMSSFEKAFSKARAGKKKTFTYKGKKYTTKLKK